MMYAIPVLHNLCPRCKAMCDDVDVVVVETTRMRLRKGPSHGEVETDARQCL
jgi:formylmethanofuran dehydrogenase subunit B